MPKKNRNIIIGSPEHSRALAAGRRAEMAAAERRRDDIRGALEHHKLLSGAGPEPLDLRIREQARDKAFQDKMKDARAQMAHDAIASGLTPKERWHSLPQDRNEKPGQYRPQSVRESVRLAMQIHKMEG